MIEIKSDSEISRIQEELQKKGVKYCMGNYVDIHGIPKGKVVPLSHLHHMAHGSELYTGYALDGLGQAPTTMKLPRCPILIILFKCRGSLKLLGCLQIIPCMASLTC